MYFVACDFVHKNHMQQKKCTKTCNRSAQKPQQKSRRNQQVCLGLGIGLNEIPPSLCSNCDLNYIDGSAKRFAVAMDQFDRVLASRVRAYPDK